MQIIGPTTIMRTSYFTSFAFATLAMASVLPDTGKDTDLPSLPNGFFTGVNRGNGSSTLMFEETDKSITFEPRFSRRTLEISCS